MNGTRSGFQRRQPGHYPIDYVMHLALHRADRRHASQVAELMAARFDVLDTYARQTRSDLSEAAAAEDHAGGGVECQPNGHAISRVICWRR